MLLHNIQLPSDPNLIDFSEKKTDGVYNIHDWKIVGVLVKRSILVKGVVLYVCVWMLSS